jgi:Protein of unknown function (DUF3551)
MWWIRHASITLATLAALAALAPSPSKAIEYPWCAVFSHESGVSNCGFVSFDQCMGYIHGIGGFCDRNPFYTGPTTQPVRKKHRKRH